VRRNLMFVLLALLLSGVTPALAAGVVGLPILGAAEEAILLPWGLSVRARVDTGAAVSSVDARSIRVRNVRGEKVVRFVLMGDGDRRAALELPLAGYRRVTNSDGGIEKRPMVEMEVCVASHRVRAEFTLNDRSRMEYHILLGRNILAGRFLVDAAAQHLSTPACPATP
jgi:hypothetical protein